MTLICDECARLKLLIKIKSDPVDRARIQHELSNHRRTHGCYWLRWPWVQELPTITTHSNGRQN